MSQFRLWSLLIVLTLPAGCSQTESSRGAPPDKVAPINRFDASAVDAGHEPGRPDSGRGLDSGVSKPGADSGPSYFDADAAQPVTHGGDAGRDGGGKIESLQRRIDEAIASIGADTCFARDDTSQCEWDDYEVGPAEFDMPSSTGESILVIDDFGDGFFPQFVRYRNHILGYYRIEGDEVALDVREVHLPRRMGDVLVSFGGPEFIPASALSQLAEPIHRTYGKLPLLYYGHGGVVFSHLIELVPEEPLVLMEMAHLLELPPGICQGIDDDRLAAAAAHNAAIASSLRRVMTEQHVRFVNASFGSTTETVATDWARTCGGAPPNNEQLRRLLHAYDAIFGVLFDTEGVLTAHAAANLGDPEDFPFDQVSAQYPNRVRVGYFSSLTSGLDEAGRGAVHSANQLPVHSADADVFLDWGCEGFDVCSDRHYQLVGNYGIASGTSPIMSTSYVTPLGVARLVNLRYANHAEEAMSNALIRTLERELTPSLCGPGGDQPCKYQDPILHAQLERDRLGYE